MKGKISIILLAFVTIWLRLVNLGYSDYQGDEIKALFLPAAGKTFFTFLLDQRKGPLQFIFTYLLKFLNPDYTDRFLLRLPFALAGIGAVFFFYKFVRLRFSPRVALFSSFFLAINGFFVAFSRIVQYQSLVIFFMILALYLFGLSVCDQKWKYKGIYFGFVSWALATLAHYDALFITPVVIYLLILRITSGIDEKKEAVKHVVMATFIFLLTLAVFYIPFVLSLSPATLAYWQGRITGTVGKITSSRYLFTVYQPIYVVHFYTILSALGIVQIMIWLKTKHKTAVVNTLVILTWFLIPFIFLQYVIKIPGTHIFTYIVPLTIISALGIEFLETLLTKVFKKRVGDIISGIGLVIVFTFMFLQSHTIFVDHTKEYPWEAKKFLGWQLSKPNPIFNLSLFGFPYYRDWDTIGNFVSSAKGIGSYASNERASITRYHLRPVDGPGEYYVYISNPQSFTDKIINVRANSIINKSKPIKEFGLTKIYDISQTQLKDVVTENQDENN